MPSLKFKNADINIDAPITDAIATIGMHSIKLEGFPNNPIDISNKHITDLKLKIGDMVNVKPDGDDYVLTVVSQLDDNAPAPKPAPKRESGMALGQELDAAA